MQGDSKIKKAASAIERYARENIPESRKAFGEFMYHAELLRKGHVSIHKKDLQLLPRKYQTVIEGIWQG
jgi:hypothetical protein